MDDDQLITLLELQTQELNKLKQDLKIKDEADLGQIKDLIRKSESSWKQLHTLIVRRLSGHQRLIRAEYQSAEEGIPYERVYLLTVIRFQIQMLHASSILQRNDQSDASLEKESSFNDALCKNLVKNMLSYMKNFSGDSQNSRETDSISDQKISQTLANWIPTYQIDVNPLELSAFKDHKLDLYWIELVSITMDQVLKAKQRKIADSGRTLNVRLMMSMNNSKKSYKEFSDFVLSFGGYYERYFLENESQDDTLEIVRNFGRLICLFCKGFSVPGRQKVEDLRATYMFLFKAFRLHHIIPKVCELLRKDTETNIFEGRDKVLLNAEIRVLIYNLYKLISFVMLALDLEMKVFLDFFRVLVYLAKQFYSNMEFFRLNRLMHLMMHKPSMSPSVIDLHWSHHLLLEYDLRLLMCNSVINLVKNVKCASDPGLKMAEKELLQLYRCLYCKQN